MTPQPPADVPQPGPGRGRVSPLLLVAVVLAYYLGARLGQLVAIPPGNVTPLWLPSGIALAAVLLWGSAVWPAVWIGALLGNVRAFIDLSSPTMACVSLAVGCIIASGSTMQALLSALLIQRFIPGRRPTDRTSDVFRFVSIEAMTCTVSPTLGVGSLCLGGFIPWSAWHVTWTTWWLGDVIGAIVLTAPLLTWFGPRSTARRIDRGLEGASMLLMLSGVTMLIFGLPVHSPLAAYPMAYLLVPLLLWAALRFGHGIMSVSVLLVSVIAVVGTVRGLGPFALGPLPQGIFCLQAFIGILTVTAMVLAAAFSERSQAQSALRESEEDFRAMFQLAGVGAVQIDPRTQRFVQVNPKFCEMTGFAAKELLAKTLLDLTHPDDRERAARGIEQMLRGDLSELAAQQRYVRKDGAVIWGDMTATLIRDRRGWARCMAAMIQDITDRKRIEEYIAFQASVLDQVRNAVIATDVDGRIVYWNKFAESMYQWRRDEVLGRQIAEVTGAESSLPQAERIMGSLMQSGHWEGEFLVKRRDGTVFPALVVDSTIEDLAGKIVGFVGVSVDISERKRTEQHLALQYAVTSVLAASSTVAEVLPRILEAVCMALELKVGALWQVDQDDSTLSCVELWHAPETRAEQFAQASRARTFGPGVGLPGRVYATGKPAWIPDVAKDANFPRAEIAASEGLHGAFGFPVKLGGQVIGVMEFFSHEIRPFDEELLRIMATIGSQIGQFIERTRADEQVRSSLREKEVLLKEIHHRVKNNMQVISSLLSLQSDHIKDPALGRLLSDSQDRIRSMALVHETLYGSTNLSSIDLRAYIESLTAHLVQSYAVKGRVRLERDTQRVLLGIDAAVPCGLLLNELISNALKHAFPGERSGMVTVKLERVEDDQLRLVVSDNGIGLPADVEPSKSHSLGLRLVSALAEQLGGRLELSREGGTTFTVLFPTNHNRRTSPA